MAANHDSNVLPTYLLRAAMAFACLNQECLAMALLSTRCYVLLWLHVVADQQARGNNAVPRLAQRYSVDYHIVEQCTIHSAF